MTIVTPAVSDPVSVDEAKAHCRVDFDTDDAYITSLITAATDWVQRRTSRQLVTATLKQSWDSYPRVVYPSRLVGTQYDGRIWYPGMETAFVPLDREPLQSVSFVQYQDANDVTQTVDPANYWVDKESTPPRVVPKNSWPTIFWGRPNAFCIQFVAGYGEPADVPQALRLAIMWLLAHWYENREAIVVNQYAREVPMSVESVCQQYETSLVR